MRLSFLAMALLAGACAPIRTRETPALVYRYEAAGFRDCTLTLGWSDKQLAKACGEPLRRLPWTTHPNESSCWLYESHSHSLGASNAGAPFFMACLDVVDLGTEVTYTEGKRTITPVEPGPRVVQVFGMDRPPP